jgi:hypothetical protein
MSSRGRLMSLCLSAKRTSLVGIFLSLSLLVVLVGAPVARAGAQIFPVEPSIALPSVVDTGVFSDDFNGDELPDTLVYLAQGTPSLLVLLSRKDSAPTQVLTSLSPTCGGQPLAVADVNGDQKLDVVLACSGTSLAVLLGNGDGTFQAPILNAFPSTVGSLALADFNGDGLPDVVYLITTSAEFAVALNESGGHFGTPNTYPLTTLTLPTAIASGDFNGDGKQDLIFANAQGSATYVLGNGNGTFGSPQALPANVGAFTVADFNRDGYSDLAYSTVIDDPDLGQPFYTNLAVLLGSTNGLATSGQTIPTNGSQAGFLVAVDLTGSGNLDLVQGSPTNTLVFLGDGKGNFSPPSLMLPILSLVLRTSMATDFLIWPEAQATHPHCLSLQATEMGVSRPFPTPPTDKLRRRSPLPT